MTVLYSLYHVCSPLFHCHSTTPLLSCSLLMYVYGYGPICVCVTIMHTYTSLLPVCLCVRICIFLIVLCVFSLLQSSRLLSHKLPCSLCFINSSLLDRLLSTSLLCFPKLLNNPPTKVWPLLCHLSGDLFDAFFVRLVLQIFQCLVVGK